MTSHQHPHHEPVGVEEIKRHLRLGHWIAHHLRESTEAEEDGKKALADQHLAVAEAFEDVRRGLDGLPSTQPQQVSSSDNLGDLLLSEAFEGKIWRHLPPALKAPKLWRQFAEQLAALLCDGSVQSSSDGVGEQDWPQLWIQRGGEDPELWVIWGSAEGDAVPYERDGCRLYAPVPQPAALTQQQPTSLQEGR